MKLRGRVLKPCNTHLYLVTIQYITKNESITLSRLLLAYFATLLNWSQIILPYRYHAERLSAPVPSDFASKSFQLPKSGSLRMYRSGSGNSTNAPNKANSCITRTSDPMIFLIKPVLFKASERMIPWIG